MSKPAQVDAATGQGSSYISDSKKCVGYWDSCVCWPANGDVAISSATGHTKNLLNTKNGRLLTFGLRYISEGIPYGFTSTAMVAFMRSERLSLELIGTFVAALFLPWAFKWAWAP
ncbi:MAG: hypothetical protein OER85_19860 [Gammaproteobacteria bacterium]|nr:hypothetical protein [Gammaproteobacteria bacterium]